MDLDKQKIEELAEKYNLELLLLFGSQASGKANKLSDFDFGYVSKNELDYIKRSELMHDLAMLVKFPDVEDVNLKEAGPFLLKEIVKNNRVIFEKNGSYADFFSKATRKYFEAEPFFRLQSVIYEKRINQYKKEYAQ